MTPEREVRRFGLHGDSTVLHGDLRASRTRAVVTAIRKLLEEKETKVLLIKDYAPVVVRMKFGPVAGRGSSPERTWHRGRPPGDFTEPRL